MHACAVTVFHLSHSCRAVRAVQIMYP